MTQDNGKPAQNRSTHGFDAPVTRQIEIALDGSAEFQARYADVAFVWVAVAWVLKWGMAIGAIVAIANVPISIATIGAESGNWLVSIVVAAAFAVGFAFFSYIHGAMKIGHKTQKRMAAVYKQNA